jgi:DNA-binding MarR family transcriptional regulator/GNAT superfamily N-acetyltransferase
MSTDAPIKSEAAAVRAFNRFYTQRIGVLDDTPLNGPFSLTEARVLYELAHLNDPTAADLCRDLALDRGYLSRILARFEKQGFLKRAQSAEDGRRSHIALTAKGAKTFAGIDSAWQDATEELIAPLSKKNRQGLVSAMDRISMLLGANQAEANRATTPRITLRKHRSGDMGWLVYRHAVVYRQEFGWNEEFEALVAEILAAFIRNYDPKRERCWIADRNGVAVGSVFLVKETDQIGRLRLLFVDPSARGLGIGRKLVDACVELARKVGYRKVTLWTNDVLVSARRIYQAAGFRLVKQWDDRAFGKDLVGQDWEIEL